MTINFYHNWTPLKLAFHKGAFLRAKYIQHSAWVSVTLFNHQFDLMLKWKNNNPDARY